MGDANVPDVYWKNLLAITTKATAESNSHEVTPRVMSDENRKWLEQVMKDLAKESDPGRQMDAILTSLHSYAANPSQLNENDIGKIEELTDHLEDILGYAEITNTFVKKGGLLVIEAFLEFLFKLIGSISGSVRSHIESFEMFCANNGPEALSRIVRRAKGGKLAGKAARVLTSIAYTLEDSPSHVKLVTSSILENFLYVLQHFSSDCCAELEYIGEYVRDFVKAEDIPADNAKLIISCLESGKVRLSVGDDLLKKLKVIQRE
ncbi:unnamed protein product [Nippostrongylus brasiliensis]|uniref:TOG domain-containing protein n=1 Tax=Nippostrongylus brasiliensis TaxID=27835 RepID=A0A0N4YXV6_NIPBR|nr:unnamed protein product [Nippostrongylus brasiliensis]